MNFNKLDCDVTIIIPCQNDLNFLQECLDLIEKQELLPKKIILVDSSSNELISNFINNNTNKINLDIIYKKIKKSYAGKSTNYGSLFCTTKYLAFLDTKTMPNKNWLKYSFEKIKKHNFDIIFGNTTFKAKSIFQKYVNAVSYGNIAHETVPGTLIKSKIFNDEYFFNENLRSGYDIEWRDKVKKKYLCFNPSISLIIYSSLSKNLLDLYKRYIIYSYHSAKAEIQISLKSLYLSIFFIFASIVIPQWNLIISGWENNPLFIPYVARLYLIFVAVIFFIYSIIFYLYNKISFLSFFNIFHSTLKIIIILLLIYGFFEWSTILNNEQTSEKENINFITNIVLILVIGISFIYRGLLIPIKRKIDFNFLIPFNFILISLLGLSLDIIKSPFYVLGAIVGLLKLFKFKKKKISKLPNLIFYTKYGNQSASTRYRFNAYEKILKNNNYNVIKKPLFDKNFFDNKIFDNKINFFRVILNYLLRLLDISLRKKPFIAIIHIELFPFLSIIGELILHIRGIPYIVDIDDAVYHRFDNYSFLKKIIYFKFKKIVEMSSGVFAGSRYHMNFFKKNNHNLTYMPTVINSNEYFTKRNNVKFETFTIIWIGTPSTSIYLKEVVPIFKELKKIFDIQIILIGIGNLTIKNLDYLSIPWEENREIEFLSKSHLGIMPLKSENWSLGKCGFKILQYMGAGIPVVASGVGVNNEIIQNGENGFLVNHKNDWFNKIKLLIENKEICEKFSINGYNTVKEKYDINILKNTYLESINEVTRQYYKNIKVLNLNRDFS